MFVDEPEEVITDTKIQGQLGSNFPVVLDVTAPIILAIVGFRDIGKIDCASAAKVINSSLGRVVGGRRTD